MKMSNSFMGWTEKTGQKTGFFHIQQVDGRWWMIDPEGNVFLSLGINHVGPKFLFWEYNRSHWQKKYGHVPDPFDLDEFRQCQGWRTWIETVREDFRDWGFNTMGALSTIDARPPELPYTMMVPWFSMSHSAPLGQIQFPDVFSSEFEKQCDEIAKNRCQPVARDPLLQGYFYLEGPILTKEIAEEKLSNLVWGFKRGKVPTWPECLKSARLSSWTNAPTPGKRVYVELMRQRYDSISAFNHIYGTNCETFRTLFMRDMSTVRPIESKRVAEDDEAFLKLILEQYYQVTHDAIRRYDPNHLIFGDRYNGHGPSSIPDVAIEAMKPHVDVFSVHRYGFFEEIKNDLERWHRLSSKPVFLTDPGFSVPSKDTPNPFGPHVESQEARGRAYEEYARSVFALPYVIGLHWCGYIDVWSLALGDRQYTGIKDATERPYPVASVMKRVNAQLYQCAAHPDQANNSTMANK